MEMDFLTAYCSLIRYSTGPCCSEHTGHSCRRTPSRYLKECFSPSNLYVADRSALCLRFVAMPSSLVGVNKGGGWQNLAETLSNIRACEGVDTRVFHLKRHTVHLKYPAVCIRLARSHPRVLFHCHSNSSAVEHEMFDTYELQIIPGL